MVDLSGLSLADLERAVEAEKQRRKEAAINELEAIAAQHGFSLSDFSARNKKPSADRPKRRYIRKRERVVSRGRGEAREEIRRRLDNGEGIEFIAKQMGYANSGAVYKEAKAYRAEKASAS